MTSKLGTVSIASLTSLFFNHHGSKVHINPGLTDLYLTQIYMLGDQMLSKGHLQRCNSWNELIEERVDSLSESWVSCSQFHVFVTQKPAGKT